MASADMLLETLIGKSIEDVKKLSKQDILDLGYRAQPCSAEVRAAFLKVAKAAAYKLEEAQDDLVE
jgi:nitrogen fixation NifU-like protein